MHKKRINILRSYMEQHRLAAVVVAPDASWEYVAAVPRLGSGNTKQRQNSSQYSCLVVTPTHAVALMAQLHYIVTTTKLAGRQAFAELVPFPDGDLCGDTFLRWMDKLGLRGRTIGISQDVSAAVPLLLQQQLGVQCIDCSGQLTAMRSVKCAEEIAILETAAAITKQVYDDLLASLAVGASTRELEIELDKIIERRGGSCTSFPTDFNLHGKLSGPMVGCSHHTLEKGYVLGLDFGLMYKGYCTDVGRTVFIGEPSPEHLQILETVLQAQQKAIALLQPGTGCGEVAHMEARRVLEHAGYGEQFIHKLGHGIGMDVHERPFLALGERQPLLPGMVFAVEPSVFRPHDCFIRVEDNVLVTPEGPRELSLLPKEIVVIE